MTNATQLDQLCINTLRTLSIDAVQQAQSGHPGTPMGAAPLAYCLWQRFLRYDPENPDWPNRDRFVLSAGHASMLLYSLLFLSGVKTAAPNDDRNDLAITLDDIKRFRQADSRCTGHPEYGWTSGVETTTGPLGQGAATSVGMAIAERWMAATYNRPDYPLFEHNVYALCGDGDMMEGVSSEAASLAGHLQLANLCWIYDQNHISIEGSTRIAFTEDVAARFVSYGWRVEHVSDANDLDALADSYDIFLNTHDRPTLIIVQSHIGYGAPNKQDTKEAHGEALGPEEVRLTKTFYGWDPDARFYVPDGVVEHFSKQFGCRGAALHAAWVKQFSAYRKEYPALAEQIDRMQRCDLPEDWDSALPFFPADAKGLATRAASGKVLNAIAEKVPWLIGGAADLAPSTKTGLNFERANDFQSPDKAGNYHGRNLHYGVREHAMAAISNGLSLSGLRPYSASFLVFSDYCRGALRLSAMMKLPIISIWTHDSINLGEDGPTHQPVEHLASLRAMPGMIVLRPADANEVVEAWRVIMQIKDSPVCLVLSRQALTTLDRNRYAPANGVSRGAYILAGSQDCKPDVLLMGTGSEVALCIAAYEQLKEEKMNARVISLPSWELFEKQSQEYRDSVLPPQISARVAVEAASSFGWERYTGSGGSTISVDRFGLSAPMKTVAQRFGFDAAHVVAAAKEQIARHTPKN
ncbi:transketolase [Nitrosomonas sp. Nm51]|uniref:transketolase n=1 Tax=Nitrosomonas sp. Nm51 TaxID=133720 RepID=UPI0008D63949|nr:transketolase [Nitrosomonas sp. Nm51]SER58293.1 transketolase [Nitrosomonas sp. Nm51]